MKTNFTLLLFITLFSGVAIAQNDTLAKWTFPTGTAVDSLPELFSDLNSDVIIFTEGGTSVIDFSKNGETTKSAQASGWDAGSGVKSWQITVNTTGYENILVSSVQTAGTTNPGPKDFKLQYKLSVDGEWFDVEGGEITVADDWTTGKLDNLLLPVECSDAGLVYLRWVMTSNLDLLSTELISSGKGKIDNIIIVGSIVSDINKTELAQLEVYPNPSNGVFKVSSPIGISNISLYNVTGVEVFNSSFNAESVDLDFSNFEDAMYILQVTTSTSEKIISKLIIRN